MDFKLAPSILSSDFGNLQRDIEKINHSKADWIHVDIMDGVFVPNISIGFPVLKSIKEASEKPLDVHLMIVNPERYIKQFYEAGASVISIHYEACIHLHRTLNEIRESGVMAGVVLNPHTPVSVLENIITECDLVLLMSVNPGFAAQKFISGTFDKVVELKKLISKKNPSCLIEVDGGVSLDNARELISKGVNVLVAGNSIFASSDIITAISDFKDLGKEEQSIHGT